MVPFYPNSNNKQEYQWMDIYNVLGRSKRTIFVGRFLDDESCNQLIASLIWLQGQNDKDPITLYFNVPGAIMKPALAVYDVMRRLKCPIITINIGLTVGMGAVLCSLGTPGQRYAFPNARFLMSRTGIEDSIEGQATELSLAIKEILKDNFKISKDLAIITKQSLTKITDDFKRDFYLTAPEAVSYGIIDKVLQPNQPVKLKVYRGDDDDIVKFGHFSEARKVAAGSTDPTQTSSKRIPKQDDPDFDEYVSKEMERKGGDRSKLGHGKGNTGNDRFANSRLRPPGWNKKFPPKDNTGNNGDKFKNSGF